MTLKSIELIGFKSFGKKSVVEFKTAITSIVGPNGSGKSNIVEAIRFVLGEQSMKSLRGKGGVDLIFKGSKDLSSSNRAKVTITFDNSKKIFSFTNSGLGIPIDYDEITISREVFPDGINKYSINNTEVRLKDIVDLLASVNIGSSGHHIISQGEADRVLNASNKDRRGMIEDALGLKVYQYRIHESERKLDKTIINIKEIQSLRREIAPHLVFLKKQVQVIEKARLMRDELNNFYKTYISNESTYINNETKRLTHLRRNLDEQGLSLDERIDVLKKDKEENTYENKYSKQIKENENELINIRNNKEEISRKLGRLEGIIEGLEREISRLNNVKEKVITPMEWNQILFEIEEKIDEALTKENLMDIIDILNKMKEHLKIFNDKSVDKPQQIDEKLATEYSEMKLVRDDTILQLNKVNEKENESLSQISGFRQKEKEAEAGFRDNERVLYELLQEKNEVVSNLHSLHFEEEKLSIIKNAYEMEIMEAAALIGREAVEYSRIEVEGIIERSNQEELRRKIERIKIKLEDIGSSNGADTMKEYKETEERDFFLTHELDDLNKSINSLHLLIQDLKETLDLEFKNGVNKINKQFQEFFTLMFGGGSAFLSITMENKKSKKNDETILEGGEIENEEEDTTELGFERGIEINVTLPHKKVKDLHMLSGGERSLTSIALLFAISQVNPPPFLVLDETDAALDEANSRKYGNMLLNLSEYSQLIVVTHNRETMSRAQVLYGVTMSGEGSSKLLSIHLEDAETYAK